MKRILLAAAATLLFASPALAQGGSKAPPTAKAKTLTIEAIDVNGDRVSGQLGPISINEAARSTSLIRIRRDFIDLILKSAEEL